MMTDSTIIYVLESGVSWGKVAYELQITSCTDDFTRHFNQICTIPEPGNLDQQKRTVMNP